MGQIPKGMSVRFEGAKPSADDVYRSSDPEPGVLIVEHRWRNTEGLAGRAMGCACAWVLMMLYFFQGFSGAPNWYALPVWLIVFALLVRETGRVFTSGWGISTITVDAVRLASRHDPKSSLVNHEVARGDLDELYCKKIELLRKEGLKQAFTLVARLRSGREVELMARLEDPEPWMFAVEQISAYLLLEPVERFDPGR